VILVLGGVMMEFRYVDGRHLRVRDGFRFIEVGVPME
jgi:hypothetical protein